MSKEPKSHTVDRYRSVAGWEIVIWLLSIFVPKKSTPDDFCEELSNIIGY